MSAIGGCVYKSVVKSVVKAWNKIVKSVVKAYINNGRGASHEIGFSIRRGKEGI